VEARSTQRIPSVTGGGPDGGCQRRSEGPVHALRAAATRWPDRDKPHEVQPSLAIETNFVESAPSAHAKIRTGFLENLSRRRVGGTPGFSDHSCAAPIPAVGLLNQAGEVRTNCHGAASRTTSRSLRSRRGCATRFDVVVEADPARREMSRPRSIRRSEQVRAVAVSKPVALGAAIRPWRPLALRWPYAGVSAASWEPANSPSSAPHRSAGEPYVVLSCRTHERATRRAAEADCHQSQSSLRAAARKGNVLRESS
jgi:hypothetical protein